jgi:Xylose isomerase-like TIM barrel
VFAGDTPVTCRQTRTLAVKGSVCAAGTSEKIPRPVGDPNEFRALHRLGVVPVTRQVDVERLDDAARQALALAELYPAATVGVVVDTFHVWWDPDLPARIAEAGVHGRISSYQVCDWLVPMAADPLMSRGMMGDGVIDFAAIGALVRDAGYRGDVEVEIFNEAVWAADGHAVIETMKRRYRDLVLPALSG